MDERVTLVIFGASGDLTKRKLIPALWSLYAARPGSALGLRVGDKTTKLRRLYPRAQYADRRTGYRRNEYWLVTRHGPCIGVCTPFEEAHGVDYPRLTAQVFGGHVIAIWVPVFGQGE